MKNKLFNLKAVQTGAHKAKVGAGAETFRKSELELEQKTNSFGFATLCESICTTTVCTYTLKAIFLPFENMFFPLLLIRQDLLLTHIFQLYFFLLTFTLPL
jgi:hypothetical protein